MEIKIKNGCDRIETKKGEHYTAEKYIFDPYGKVYLKEKDCFEYVCNIEFLSVDDKLNFYKN